MCKTTLFIFAAIFGLTAALPMPMIDLESALLVPEFERATNESVVLEQMPLIKDYLKGELFTSGKIEKMKLLHAKMEKLQLEYQVELEKLVGQMETFNKHLEKNLADELTSEKLVEEINSQIDNEFDASIAKNGNETIKQLLNKNSTERAQFLGTQMNKTQRDEIVKEEINLINLEKQMVLAQKVADEMKMKISNTKLVAKELEGEIKKVESEELNESLKNEDVEIKENETTKSGAESVKEKEIEYNNEAEEDREEIEEDNEDDEDDEDDEEEEKPRQARAILEALNEEFEQKKREESEFIASEYCKIHANFEYYKIYPNDLTKYVECDVWGNGTLKSCPEGKMWDQFHKICSTEKIYQTGQNLTLEMEKLEEMYSKMNCNNSVEFECMNDGKCESTESGHECVCTEKYTGDLCEHLVIKHSIFSKILKCEFSIAEFKENLSKNLENFEITAAEMENIKNTVKESTHEELMKYLASFKDGEVRYDIVLESLIDSILEDIYPDVYYLSLFNASSENFFSVVQTIPSLISYSKYTDERYAEVFGKYQEVLEKLVANLNETWVNVESEASEYLDVCQKVWNETNTENSLVRENTSVKQTMESLEEAFKKHKEEETEFVLKLEALRVNSIEEMKSQPELAQMKLSEMSDNENAKELIGIFDLIAARSEEVMSVLQNYGFWAVTDALTKTN